MPHYRLCRVNGAGSIVGKPRKIERDDDVHAIAAVEMIADGECVEVWQGIRVVAILRKGESIGLQSFAELLAPDRFHSRSRYVAV